jgi:hypothetical protein
MRRSNNHPGVEATDLRAKLSDFLTNRVKKRVPLQKALDRLEKHPWKSVVFGGVLRDLALFGNAKPPRDVDVVVLDANGPELEGLYEDILYRKNRFGGLQLRSQGWLIDVWAIQDSWAFKQKLIAPIGFDQLVQTTFLNVEAIAIEVTTSPGIPRKIYSAGFFEAIRQRVLDISFEPNPFPELCVVRSLVSASSLKFAVSRRLAEYLVKHGRQSSIKELIDVQVSHYGDVKISADQIAGQLAYLERKVERISTEAIKFPTFETPRPRNQE